MLHKFMTSGFNSKQFYWITCACLLLFFFLSLYSPPSFVLDPGIGFFDLINFSEGGRFQYHHTPLIGDIDRCIEERTTWWSPGQWFFIYLFTLTGLPLGVAISVTVLIARWFGIIGWVHLYRRFQFSEATVLTAGLVILFSRYLFSSFQIYPGASILEFAAAPWLLLFWMELEKKPLWLQAVCLLLLLIGSYFIKSSMLIFWLAVLGSCVSLFQLKQIPWQRLIVLAAVFVAGKYCCDLIFTQGGATPFSYPGKWFSLHGGNTALLLQHLLFIISAPLLASFGADDYIRYFFQKPGAVIFQSGHPAMLLIYGAVFMVFLLLARYFISKRKILNPTYSNLLVAAVGVFVGFFFYSYISEKSINGFEESRHMRLAGLILLPLLIQWLYGFFKRYLLLLPLLMFGYAVISSFNKVRGVKVISDKHRIPMAQIMSVDHYRFFREEARKSDFTYVINADLKLDLDHCKTIYYQDDFLSLDLIKARPKTIVRNKVIVFFLPIRFVENGKKQAILANFVSAPGSAKPGITVYDLNNYQLIAVHYF